MADPLNVPPRTVHTGPDEVLRRLDLAVAHKIDGLLHGEYQGLVPGHGSELGETRAYAPGDDVRRIDWNVTARTRTPYVRDTIADRELETWALVDLGPSMDFGTAHCEKRDLAVSAAAAIGFLTARTGNRFGALLATPDDVEVIPARGGRNHLMATLHRLVTAPRAESGTVDLGAAIEEILTTLGPTLKKSPHRIDLVCAEKVVCETAPGALYQIITNLLMNSLIHAFPDGRPGRIGITVARHGKTIAIEYEDNGVGMDEVACARIFDPFFTTRRGSGGSGLGMHIVYNLVTQVLGGTIVVDSAPGAGFRLSICFKG